jgi:hypothetical protein
MSIQHDAFDFVIGVDTHKRSHTAAVLNRTGAVQAVTTAPAHVSGFRQLLSFARAHASTRRVWAIEGTGSFGRGLTTFLAAAQESVVEIDRPARPASRNGAKADDLDAVRAGRELLQREHLAQPRRSGDREALRVLLRTRQSAVAARQAALGHFQALLITAPDALRARLDDHSSAAAVRHCALLRSAGQAGAEQRATIAALRTTARRIRLLTEEARAHEREIHDLVRAMAPALLQEAGIGALTAAELLCAWSHRGRVRSEAAFAMLAGVAPVAASSGSVIRYRLNRGGDRHLNRALHTIVLTRLRNHPDTRTYAARRTQQGKSPREIRRCLKRFVARRLFRLLEHLEARSAPSPSISALASTL